MDVSQMYPNALSAPMYFAPQRRCSSRSMGWLGALLVVVLFVMGVLWFCSGKRNYGATLKTQSVYAPRDNGMAMMTGGKDEPMGDPRQPRDLRCGIPQGPAQDTVPAQLKELMASEPVGPVAGVRATAAQNTPDPQATLSFTPNVSFPLGAPFLSESFAPSEATAEFYQTFNPTSLSQMMPANWRPDGGANCTAEDIADGRFDDFSRYAISPQSVQESENVRGILRLREMTETTNSKALGLPSLLRNYVTPLSAIPIGDRNFIFNDSSQRLAYIASATGQFPKDTGC